MKTDIHPNYQEITTTCSCGNVLPVMSTLKDNLSLDVCAKCHPFYTGKQKMLDSGGRVKKFQDRFGAGGASKPAAKKAEAKVEETAVEEAAEEVLETPVEEVAEETIAEELKLKLWLKRLLPMKLRTLLRQKLTLSQKAKKTNKLLLNPRTAKSFIPSFCFREIFYYP